MNPEDYPITFGKFAGQTVRQVLSSDDGIKYARWVVNQSRFSNRAAQQAFAQALANAKL